jgi:hypothetical protein
MSKKAANMNTSENERTQVVTPNNSIMALNAGTETTKFIDEFEQESIALLKARVEELEKQLAEARNLNHKKKVLTANGFCSYNEFFSLLVAHLGTNKRALTTFVDNTPYTEALVQQWRRRGTVPLDALSHIDQLPIGTTTVYQKLSQAHKDRIDQLVIDGKSDSEITDIMNAEQSDRMFNVNMVKSAKAQIRIAFLRSLKDNGMSKDEARDAFIKQYPRVRMVDKILDSIY